MKNPELISAMIKEAYNVVAVPISLKVRILPDENLTVEFARRAEMAGASFITVHGRTPYDNSAPANYHSIRLYSWLAFTLTFVCITIIIQ
jgi:tRNA-dihydrouridine synthase